MKKSELRQIIREEIHKLNEGNRRSIEFFEESLHGKNIYKILGQRWNTDKVRKYLDKLNPNNDIKWIRALGFIARDLGMNPNDYETGIELEDSILFYMEKLFKEHQRH